ncbi:MAG: hypothetical protein NZ824_03835 [Candidatus Thioglobus sp.]|nr:hypothetical protein [Candidatus Thioglobus sp.]
MAEKGESKISEVTDEELTSIIDTYVTQAVGGLTSGSELSSQREDAMDYYTQQPRGRLTPTGVSSVVTSDTMEIIDSYLSVISELMLSNNKIARFNPKDPSESQAAKLASEITNDCIFEMNNGWVELNTWIKSALLFKNAAIRWKWVETTEYEFEEYEGLSPVEVDTITSDPNIEIVELVSQDIVTGDSEDMVSQQVESYSYIKIRKSIDKSKIVLENIPPESFLIDKDTTSIADAKYVGIQTEYTISDLREMGFDNVDDISDEGSTRNGYTNEDYTRQALNGTSMAGFNNEDPEDSSMREVYVTESWLRVDRDGDGIAELKRVISVGSTILLEEDAKSIPIANLNPIEIPYAFYGISMADATKSATEVKTAITRGIVENIYLTNYSRILADPNTVDFRALQSPEPHQIIPTNGNPLSAVQQLQPSTISPSSFSLLEFMNNEKETATGMSRTAQGINSDLFKSGNDANKVSMIEQASQKRIAYIARRFAETGFSDMCKGVYSLILDNSESVLQKYSYYNLTPDMLKPFDSLTVDVDVGSNSSTNTKENMTVMMSQIMPALYQTPESKGIINPAAPFNIARQMLESMGIDNWPDFLVDPSTPEGQQQAQAVQQQGEQDKQEAQRLTAVEEQKLMIELEKQKVEIETKIADMNLDREKFAHQVAKDKAEVALEASQGRAVGIG